MRTPRQETGSAEIQLRLSQFDRHCKAKGLKSAHARANFIGVHRGTITRIEAGDVTPSERFIALVLAAFSELKFEDLFEVIVPDPETLRRAS